MMVAMEEEIIRPEEQTDPGDRKNDETVLIDFFLHIHLPEPNKQKGVDRNEAHRRSINPFNLTHREETLDPFPVTLSEHLRI